MATIYKLNDNYHLENNLPTLSANSPEEHFINLFEKYLERGALPRRDKEDEYYHVREFALCGYGIADMLLVPKLHLKERDKEATFFEKIASSPSLSKLLLQLPKTKNINKEELSHEIGVSKNTLNGLLRFLFIHALIGDKNHSISDLDTIVPKFELWAFEAKMADWKKAVKQAYRYGNFANKTTVILPKKAAKNAQKNLSVFRRLRVGLWSYDPDSSTLKPFHTPRTHKTQKTTEANLRARALVYAKILQVS